MQKNIPFLFKCLTLGVAVWLAIGGLAQAQQMFRSIGADGKVTFSDRPPADQEKAKTQSLGSSNSANRAPNSAANTQLAGLPFALRQVVSKYPVTLYTSEQCNACAVARSMLLARGIPFTEKTISTSDDVLALQRLSGDNSLPFATLGGQQLKGYAELEWNQYLSAAGYPSSSQLPSNYRQAAATPLVKIAEVSAAAKSAEAAKPANTNNAAPAANTGTAPLLNNPNAIRF